MATVKLLSNLANRKQLRVAGLMSGTSADGIDVAIVDIASNSQKIAAYGSVKYPPGIRKAVLELCNPALSGVDKICHYNFLLGHLFAEAVIRICQKNRIRLKSIDLIGSHGQTIYHIPSGIKYGSNKIRSTLQIAEPSVIAEKTGITTVADFRPRDIACGGQGAPLVPFTDFILFGHKKINRALQNIGGISNVTWLPAGGGVKDILAFDSGPGNMIIDAIMTIITNGRMQYDRNGSTARKGTINQTLLKKLLKHSYFRLRPPKSTGREAFGLDYSKELYNTGTSMKLSGADIVATATAFTAETIADAYRRFLPKMPDELMLCGGGAKNAFLVELLKRSLGSVNIRNTGDFGIDVDAKEAVSFAILAWATINGIPNNVPGATGAKTTAILGKIVPGKNL